MASLNSVRRDLARGNDLRETMQLLVHYGGQLPEFASTHVGMNLRLGRGALQVAASDTSAHRWEEAQHDVGDGPALDAMRERRQIVTPQLASDLRWPSLRARGLTDGVSSVLSTPMLLPGGATGVVTFYSTAPNAFGELEYMRAQHSSVLMGGLLASVIRYDEAVGRILHLNVALRSRTSIDQAIGVLMAQNRCSGEKAFRILTRASQNRNKKLRDLSVEILTSVAGSSPAPPPTFQWTPMTVPEWSGSPGDGHPQRLEDHTDSD